MSLSRLLCCVLFTAPLLACSAGGASGDGDGGSAGDGGTGASSGGGSGGSGFAGGMNTGGGEPLVAEVFGHSADTLYKLDPITHAVTEVGPFLGCSNNIIDLAIDKDNNIYATSYEEVYRIDSTTAACTQLLSGDYPNSLSFVPQGTVDANEEALVGYLDADYVRIDTTTGAVTTIGAISGGYISSGDIVSVIGGGTYLTVKGMDCDTTDCLFEINPTTGDMVKNWGHVPYDNVFGLAFWGGSAYGFSDGGDLFEITFNPNDTVSTVSIPISNPPQDLSFWGAGSATSAPLVPPS